MFQRKKYIYGLLADAFSKAYIYLLTHFCLI